jgi:hypothetical protein
MQDTSDLTPGMHVLLRAFDDVPEHVFELHTIEDGFVTGMALTGPFAGEYGEPDIELVLRVLSPDTDSGSQGTA